MKKLLLLLLTVNAVHAQTTVVSDTTTTSVKEIFKDEVIVSGTRANSNSPTTFQVLSKEELNENNLGQDLPFLLDMTPGAVTTSDAGTGIGYTGLRIRGSDNTRVNVTLNGIPVNDAAEQGTYWVDLPDMVSNTQNIQIQRGVGTSTNGPGAFGGTLSLQTQTPSIKPFGQVDVSGGSFHTFKLTGKVGTGLIKERWFAEGSASWITSDGYIERASSNLRSYFAQAGYMHNNTLIKLLYFGGREKTYQAWDGVLQDSLKTNRRYNDLGTDYGQHFPPYANQTDNYSQDYFQLLFAQQLPKNFYLNLGLFATLGRGYYEEYKVGQDYNSYFPGYDTLAAYTDLVRQKWLKNIFYGGTFSLDYHKKNFSATLGGLFSQFAGRNFGKVIWAQNISTVDPNARYYDGPSTKNDFDVYAKFNYEVKEKLNFYLDLQYRYVNYKTHGTDDDLSTYSFNNTWHFFNPKAGLMYKIKPSENIYLSYALGHREPNRDDILAGKTNTPIAETLHDVEAGYKTLFKLSSNVNWAFNADYYMMYYKDQLVLTGRLNDVGNPIKANVPQSYRTGIELSGGINILKTCKEKNDVMLRQSKVFAINYAFAYSVNKIKSFDEYIYTYDENYVPVEGLTEVINHKNTNISFSPSVVASLELAAYPVKGLSLSLTTKAVSKQYLDNTSSDDRMIKPFYYSNINISYTLPLNKPGKEITFKLLLNNIFNHLYESNGYTYSERYAYTDENNVQQVTPVSTYNYYNPQAGFNVLAGMTARF